MPLELPGEELEAEARCFAGLARPYLTSGALAVLHQYERQLSHFRNDRKQSGKFAVAGFETITTRQYEPPTKKGGALDVKLRFSGQIKIEKSRKNLVYIQDSSWMCTMVDAYRNESIGMWRAEIGKDDSPGIRAHITILGKTRQNPFPKTVPVPRFPSLFVSPMGALEFCVGEFFRLSCRFSGSRMG